MKLSLLGFVVTALICAAQVTAAAVERIAPIGAASCVASTSQPRVFKGIFVAAYSSFIDGSPVYGYPSPRSLTNSTYVYHNNISSVFLDKYHYEGVKAYPCDSVASRVNVTLDGSFYIPEDRVSKVQTGILRSSKNPGLCLKAVKGFSQAPGDANYPSFAPCPVTDTALVGKSGQFIWSWAYDPTIEFKKVDNTPTRPKGTVYVTFTGPKIDQPQFRFGEYGRYTGSLGNENALSIVGSQIYVAATVLQLAGAYNGDIAAAGRRLQRRHCCHGAERQSNYLHLHLAHGVLEQLISSLLAF
ncbi:unnamed protein product [Tilletia controversa]|uniref:Uncharacterized protein n=3 Tax=Tilletia TaxID=13289 RepID=A0A8X7MQQ8_9BASI|nr:hypothetical protein CF336_g5012 [Tilletia laevis]KAE8194299.1 hypothetical protein CF328_g4792 [Tilletia controversa]KAE8258266.1 hypothetical protein A4X03_0g4432 [Tilletia caries]KAE8198244.1 hypothetical protein CF335_g4428 [Tilletia laevis]KAE8245617.1 hypothetical protein A4X06_0g5541 [Tilletia controversa]